MKKKFFTLGLLLTLFLSIFLIQQGCAPAKKVTPVTPKKQNVILATTTSTQDSGLLDKLLPQFEKKTGYKVKTVAVGSGEALTMASRGEADAVLSHAPEDEKKLVKNKDVINYRLVMHNDFIIVGPSSDPAGIKKAKTAEEAFKMIAAKKAVFISRGDNSGTNKAELSLWKKAGIKPEGKWYQEASAGMGQTLDVADEKSAYTLTDRATYLTKKKTLKNIIIFDGDKSILNIYHVMQVNPAKFKKVNAAGGKAFVNFMVSPQTQKMIGDFGKDKYKQQLFVPDAGKSESQLKK